jgi:UDP-N-acetylglucosamine 2-epimerase
MQILIAESIKSRSDIQGIVTLNFSGETEKVFSYVQEKIPILYLQHGFANYTESISYFDVLDDFDSIKNKIAVWGDIIKDYLIHVKAIPENKIIVSGSPKHDSYSRIEKNEKSQKIMLVTLRPIITHMEGPRIELYEKYEEVIHKLIQISKNIENLQIIFKLHPQQNISNQIIINMIKENDRIKILQFEPIKELLSNCDLHVNIAPDNFDASSVILEAMMMGKPTLNIQLQKNEIEFEFMKENAIKSVYYDSNIEQLVLDLISNHGIEELLNNSQNFLNKYMKNRGNAAKKLIDLMMKN